MVRETGKDREGEREGDSVCGITVVRGRGGILCDWGGAGVWIFLFVQLVIRIVGRDQPSTAAKQLSES